MKLTITDSYVVCSPGGYYNDYAQRRGWLNASQYAVIKFSEYTKWYNAARFSNNSGEIAAILPAPSFVGDTLEIAKSVADELTQYAEQLTTNRKAGQE